MGGKEKVEMGEEREMRDEWFVCNERGFIHRFVIEVKCRNAPPLSDG